jgi:hypothetical protein
MPKFLRQGFLLAYSFGILDCGGSTPSLNNVQNEDLGQGKRRRRAAAVQGASRILMYSGSPQAHGNLR